MRGTRVFLIGILPLVRDTRVATAINRQQFRDALLARFLQLFSSRLDFAGRVLNHLCFGAILQYERGPATNLRGQLTAYRFCRHEI